MLGSRVSGCGVAAVFFALLAGGVCRAQTPGTWSAVGPSAVTVQSLAIDPADSNHLLAGTYFGGLYASTDGGLNWSHLNLLFGTYTVFSVVFDPRQPSVVYAGTFQAGVWKSTDSGVTWTFSSQGMTDSNVLNIAIDPNDSSALVAVTGTRVFRSSDAAANWQDISPAFNGAIPRVVAFSPVSPGLVYAGTLGTGVYMSTDGGATWNPFSDGIGNRTITALNFSDGSSSRLYAASSDGIGFELKSGASAWIPLAIWPDGPRGPVTQIFPRPKAFGILLASTNDGIYISRDDGQTWKQSTTSQANFVASDALGGLLYAAGLAGGLQTTADLGNTWTSRLTGLQNVFIGGLFSAGDSSGSHLFAASEYGVFGTVARAAAAAPGVWAAPGIGRHTFAVQGQNGNPNLLLAGTESSGVWRTEDGGMNWKPSYTGIYPAKIYSLAASQSKPSVIYAGTSAGVYASATGGVNWNAPTSVNIPTVLAIGIDPSSSLTAYFGSLGGQIYKTTTAGTSVLLVFKTDSPSDNITHIKVSPIFTSRVYAITGTGYLVATSDGGSSWSVAGPAEARITSIDVDPVNPKNIYLGTAGFDVYKSSDFGLSWTQLQSGLKGAVYSLAVNPLNPATVYAGGDSQVLRSDDGGATWRDVTNGLPGGPANSLFADPAADGTLYTSIEKHGVYTTTDGGSTWTANTDGTLPADTSTALALDALSPGRLYASSESKGIYLSQNAGGTWSSSSSGLTLFVRGVAFDAGDPNTVYAGSLLGGMFRSTDTGNTWSASGLLGKVILQVKSAPTHAGRVFAATSDGVSRSDDSGLTWSDVGQKVSYIFSIAVDPSARSNVYVAGSAGAVFRTTDGGSTWQSIHSGLPLLNVLSIAVGANSNLYAAVQTYPGQPSIYASSDAGQSWHPALLPADAASLATRLTYDTRSKALYAATNGAGLLVSFDGVGWATFNDGLTSMIVSAVIGSPTRPGTMFAATLEQGIFVSAFGQTWKPLNTGLTTRVIKDIAADALTDGLLYAVGQDGVYRTTNTGLKWARISGLPADGSIYSVVPDPFQAGVAIAISAAHLWKTTDKGLTWRAADGNLQVSGIQALQFGTGTGSLLLGSPGDGLVVSANGGDSWTAAAQPTTIAPFALCVTVDPVNGDIVYAGTSAGVIRSSDAGNTWTSLTTDTGAVIAMAIDPTNTAILYAGTSNGVYMSADTGQTWALIADGMFHRNVTSLAVDAADPRTVYAGTEGGGVFRYVRP